MKQKWVNKIIGGLSLTSMMFIFQACYGTPQDFGLDILIEGQVKSKTTGIPIKGIKVSVEGYMQYENTNEEGKFSFYTEIAKSYKIKFEDIDSNQNGTFTNKDTIVTIQNEKVYLDIVLDQK
jgi:putative lipoprotein (rSAM/lipoprotein system)